ncbi:MAG TPA: TldD/PmbA family protein [Acidobacteriota bacterium]|nr:TldD/PmbA family protein [Acidobacteriota bacterium]
MAEHEASEEPAAEVRDAAKSLDLCSDVLEMSLREGATCAEVLLHEGLEFSTAIRLGNVEKLQQANFRKLGVRVFAGGRTAVSATSDFSVSTLKGIIRDTIDMARMAGEDRSACLPTEDTYNRPVQSLEICFPASSDLAAGTKVEMARRCERAALAHDPRISNSEGSGFSDSLLQISYANTVGARSSYRRTLASLWAAPLAEMNGQKQRDSWLTAHPDISRLQSPEGVGMEAARRALRRLGARKVVTCEVPVVFDPRASAALLKHIAESVSGTALLRKASFLMDKLGQQVASPLVTMCDDALLPFGLASRPFDAEGIPSQMNTVIRSGVLESYLLDWYAARRLGLRSTANSNREPHGGPSSGPSNFHVAPGNATPDEIIASVRKGLFVTELIGFGVDIVSGNYSQGAAGLWIENGRLAFPVEEVTIAGNLKDMLMDVEAVGNDPVILAETFAPTLMISKMVVSGN